MRNKQWQSIGEKGIVTLGIGAKIVLIGQFQIMNQDIRNLPLVNCVMNVKQRIVGENVENRSPNKWVQRMA